MSEVTIADRLSKTLKEFLLPDMQDNFYLLAQKPMLRMLGMEVNEADQGSGSRPRVENVASKAERVDSGYQFQIVHNHTPFGGGTYGQKIGANLRPGKFYGDRSLGTVKFITQSMQIPAQVQHASRSPSLSVTNELVQNMYGAMHVMHEEINRMMFAPTTHALCVINGAVNNSTSIVVDNGGTSEKVPTLNIHKGDILLIGTANEIEADQAEEVEVDEVTGDTTFTTVDAETLVDNDLVVRADVWDDDAGVYTDLTSMRSLVNNTGTVQNVDKATKAWFQSRVTNAAGALTLAMVDNLAANTRRYSKNPANRFLVGNMTQWRRYSALLTTTKQIQHQNFGGQLVGGLEGLSVYTPDGSLPFFVDDDVEDGVIYLIDPSGYKWFNFRDFGPADDAMMVQGYKGQRLPNTLSYEFALWVGGQLGQVNALSSGVIYGITS